MLAVVSLVACNSAGNLRAPPAPIKAFPGDMLAGSVAVFPLNNFRTDSAASWGDLGDPKATMHRVDSILHAILTRRYPSVRWVEPVELQKAAGQAPGMLTDPYQLPTIQLQTHALTTIPAPLLSQLRNISSLVQGGRYVVVPANLWLDAGSGVAKANLVVALADVRLGAVSWSGTLTGIGETPFRAIEEAVLGLTMIRDQ